MSASDHITRPFMSGRSEAIRIPKEFRIGDREVYINRVGESLVITPVDDLADTFLKSLSMFSDDFMADGRPEEVGSFDGITLDDAADSTRAG